jgi:hypothetical protein
MAGGEGARAHAAALLAVVLLGPPTPAAALDLKVPGTTARVEAGGYVDGLAVAEIGGPRQRPQAIAELRFSGKLARWLRTQVTVRGRAGGPFEGGHPGMMNLVHEFQNRTPSLEWNEAWAEVRLGEGQVRAGIQKFAWGKLDGLPPTDVLTPRDLHDPIVRDVEESKIGIPAIQLGHPLPDVPALDLHELRATLVYVPIAVPARLALVDERWFPPSIRSSGIVLSERRGERLLNDIAHQIDPNAPDFDLDGPVRIPIAFHTLNHRPPKTFGAGGGGFRLAGTLHGMDWSISHYTGPETGPNAQLEASARCRDCGAALLGGHLPARARAFLRQEHDIIHMTGADWSTTLGGATVRAEVAVFQDRPYLRPNRDLIAQALSKPAVARYGLRLLSGARTRIPLQELFPDRDSVEWGVGADYLIEGFLPLLQVNQVVFTDDGPEQLLANPETRLLASLRKRFLEDTLEVELRGVYAFERAAWFAFPRISYRYGDHWRFRLGYLAIGGPAISVIGQFHANDEFVLEGRYSF